LPARKWIPLVELRVLGQRLGVVLLMEIAFADHPLCHGGGLSLASLLRLDDPGIRGAGGGKIGRRRQRPADEIIDFMLLVEVGKARGDRLRDLQGLAPLFHLRQGLCAAQLGHGRPGLVAARGSSGQVGQTLGR
jgi:hypothetical protein